MFFKRKFTCTEIAIPTLRLELCTMRDLLRHCNRRATQEVTEELGWEIVDSSHKSCLSCTVAKTKQRSVVKLSGHVKVQVRNEKTLSILVR